MQVNHPNQVYIGLYKRLDAIFIVRYVNPALHKPLPVAIRIYIINPLRVYVRINTHLLRSSRCMYLWRNVGKLRSNLPLHWSLHGANRKFLSV